MTYPADFSKAELQNMIAYERFKAKDYGCSSELGFPRRRWDDAPIENKALRRAAAKFVPFREYAKPVLEVVA